MKSKQPQKTVRQTVHRDAPSKPQQHRGEANQKSPTHYVAKMNPGAQPGDWQGKFVPATPAAKRAAAKAQRFLIQQGLEG